MFDSVSALDTAMVRRSRPSAPKVRSTPSYERADGRRRVVLSTWVDATEAARIDALAEILGETRSAVVRQAVMEYLAARGGFMASALDLDALDALDAGRDSAVA